MKPSPKSRQRLRQSELSAPSCTSALPLQEIRR
nr:MAG TPA: hypothetical protein [Caudoviricetes sp.]